MKITKLAQWGWVGYSGKGAYPEEVLYKKTILDNADDLKRAIENKKYNVAEICVEEITKALSALLGKSRQKEPPRSRFDARLPWRPSGETGPA